jgi:hypothetical protein
MSLIKHALLVLSALGTSPAWAWSDHAELTRTTLKGMLEGQTVAYQPLEELIPALRLDLPEWCLSEEDLAAGARAPVLTEPELQCFLKNQKAPTDPIDPADKDRLAHKVGFHFINKAGEADGAELPLMDVLATYADEPDWDMDTYLFDADEYRAQEYEEAYKMMGDTDKMSSQAFRHMYWPKWSIEHPINTLHLPTQKILAKMGKADERAAAYVDLSRRARDAGSAYWQARFLANAIHYIQDVNQPFHASQVPTKSYFLMAEPVGHPECRKDGMTSLTRCLTQIVSYYHFAYEDFVETVMNQSAELPEIREQLHGALQSDRHHKAVADYADGDAAAMTVSVATAAVAISDDAGRNARAFFPALPDAPGSDKPNYATFDPYPYFAPGTPEQEAWMSEVQASAQEPSKARDRYMDSVRQAFGDQGYAVRRVVRAELGD